MHATARKGRYGELERRTVIIIAALGALLHCVAALAQADHKAEKEATKAHATPADHSKEKQRALLTVDVLSINRSTDTAPKPAQAIVRVDSVEEAQSTDDKGRAQMFVQSKKVTLQIFVVGADPCDLRDVATTAADQTVRVIVDRSPPPRAACKLE